jgi:hypothetical protein
MRRASLPKPTRHGALSRPPQCNTHGKPMAEYRVCLKARDGRTIAERSVKAIRNYEAVEIAKGLADARNGVGYEVWRGDRKIAHRTPR